MESFVARFGPWAVVTGASSGIGEAFARAIAERGVNLVLLARREDRLRKLAEQLQSRYAVSTRIVSVDLSQGDFLPVVEQATADLQIGLLVNSAGTATTGKFLDNDLASELAMLEINNRAPLILAHHFGRSMQKQGRGGIIFVASTLAFAGIPSWTNYAASKAHELVFAEGLARELSSSGVSILALCPGATNTELWPAGTKLLFPMQPSAVADIALRKLGRKTTVVAGWINSITVFSTRLLPRSWNAAIFGWVVGAMLKGAGRPTHVGAGGASSS
jgi:short-subunit dehydrogenase